MHISFNFINVYTVKPYTRQRAIHTSLSVYPPPWKLRSCGTQFLRNYFAPLWWIYGSIYPANIPARVPGLRERHGTRQSTPVSLHSDTRTTIQSAAYREMPTQLLLLWLPYIDWFIFSARCRSNIHISRLCYDVSVRLCVRLSVCLQRKCIGAL